MIRKTFEELGREADLALRSAANAKQSVIRMGSPEAAATAISLDIKGADWENGLLYLRDHLTEVVRERIHELLPLAVNRMEDAARAQLDALKTAYDEGPAEDDHRLPERQVPRQLYERIEHRAQQVADQRQEPFMGRSPDAGYATGYTDPGQRAKHDASVAATPPAGSAQAAGAAAPSGPVGGTPAPSTTRRLQPADFLAPLTIGQGNPVQLDRQEAELFELVAAGNSKVPARGPQATKLVQLGLCQKSDKSAQAVLQLAPLGVEWIGALTAALEELPG